MTVAAVLALAVVGTGAAFAYRTYVGSPRTGEPPIIKADNSPTKVVPAPADAGAAKTPDRMVPGDGGEKIVSREETPVDVNAKSGMRVAYPPLNQNGNPPVASVAPAAPRRRQRPPTTASMPNAEPRKVKIIPVKGDPPRTAGCWLGGAACRCGKAGAGRPVRACPQPSSANTSANAVVTSTWRASGRSSASGSADADGVQQLGAPAASSGGYLVQVCRKRG